MSYLVQYALVDYRPGDMIVALAKLRTFSPGDEAMGMTHADAVQVAVGLAQLRDLVTVPRGRTVAIYRGGRFVRCELYATPEQLAKLDADPALSWVPIVGTTPLQSPPVGQSLVQLGEQHGIPSVTAAVPKDWGRQLALAIDGVLGDIADTRAGAEAFEVPTMQPALALPIVALIVGGAAVAVVGAVGVWRYFNPDLRAKTEAIAAASTAYSERLQVFERTKVMPPVSAIEEGAAAAVVEAAKSETSAAWYFGGGVAGGVALSTLALGALNRSEVRA